VPAERSEPGTGFRFRRLEKPEEYRTAEELQREALGDDAALAVPAAVLRTLQDTGGLVLGAFVDIYLAGVVVSSIGWDGATLYHQAHAVAVRPEYQNHRVGPRLLAYLRDEVLALGLPDVRGSFDPLQSRTAHVVVHRLGAVPTAYRPNYFGRRSEGSSTDPETDRLAVRWALTSADVERRLAGESTPVDALRERWSRSSALIETEPGDSGLRLPKAVVEPEAGPVHLEIPFDLVALRTHEAPAVRRWRHAVRDAFRMTFELGWVVDEFVVLPVEHERRGFYLLSRAAPSSPGATPLAPPAGGA
jgi:chorismate synthase